MGKDCFKLTTIIIIIIVTGRIPRGVRVMASHHFSVVLVGAGAATLGALTTLTAAGITNILVLEGEGCVVWCVVVWCAVVC